MQLRSCSRLSHLNNRFYSTSSRFLPVPVLRIEDGKLSGFDPRKPAVIPKHFIPVPAIRQWFKPSTVQAESHELDLTYLNAHESTIVTLELTRPGSFERFEAPLALLLSHMHSSQDPSTRLYLAQCSLNDLSSEMQADLPPPELLWHIGKGDIYGSSLWMGRAPTRTPLHRDPNPNLFVQLAGQKHIRLLEPDIGRSLYERVSTGSRHANMRGEEMMVGQEMERMENLIWEDAESNDSTECGWEAKLDSGEALYIPLGFWHAVHGVGRGINASVNWWFR